MRMELKEDDAAAGYIVAFTVSTYCITFVPGFYDLGHLILFMCEE